MNYQSICRVCIGVNSEMLSIFDSYNFSPQKCFIFKAITACASVQIHRSDGFSEQICRRCLDCLAQAYSFKKLCEESDYKLRNDLVATHEIEMRPELMSSTTINYGEAHNEPNSQENDKMDDVGETKVNTVQCVDKIISKNNFEKSTDGRREEGVARLASGAFENVKCEELSGLDSQWPSGNSDSSYKCELCSKSFATQEYLDFHMKFHAGQQFVIKSEYVEEDTLINYGVHCEIEEATDFGLSEVKKEQHNEGAENESQLNKYEANDEELHARFPKVACESFENESGASNSHRGLHSCNICNENFFRSIDLTHHNIRTHRGEKAYRCELCDMRFTRKNNLTAHMKTHTDDKPFKCHLCEKQFVRGDKLAMHVRLHMGEKPLKCNVCDKRFSDSSSLVQHGRVHTGESPYNCEFCERKFSRKSNLAVHIKSRCKGLKSYNCECCEKTFTTNSSLAKHNSLHGGEKPYKCYFCKKTFARKDYLAAHIKLHTEEKSYKCEFCNEIFPDLTSLRKHRKFHTQEKPYKCKFCEKKFRRKEYLAVHVKLHMEETPYRCNYCDKKFSHKGTLTAHIMIHTGEKPYECKLCDKKFARKFNLAVHNQSHAAEKTYACEICYKKFRYSSDLTRHRKRIHRNRPVSIP